MPAASAGRHGGAGRHSHRLTTRDHAVHGNPLLDELIDRQMGAINVTVEALATMMSAQRLLAEAAA